jgi:ferredoxin-NADP reductase
MIIFIFNQNSSMRYRVQAVVRETEDAASFILESVSGEVKYEAGQFITILFHNRNNEEERRSYSISSAPVLQEPLTITVKKVVNGAYSRKLVDTVQVGDILNGLSPTGFFTLPPLSKEKVQFVFFAAGSGITPIYAQIKTLLALNKTAEIVLVYSNRSEKDALFYNQLQSLAKKHPDQLFIRFLFSDAAHYSNARLSASMVEDIVQKHFPDSVQDAWIYLCGPFHYMLMITLVLKGMGVKDRQIKKEQFIIYKSEASQKPADTDLHIVHATIDKSVYSWKVQYPDTILQAAKKQHIDLPYNCESGQCGACAAICVKGKVWMYKNDVLVEEEINSGRILTCTAYPIGGDVEIRY